MPAFAQAHPLAIINPRFPTRQLFPVSQGAIHESIEALDRQGMAAIEAQAPEAFRDYLRATSNTICGRHPIAVLLQVR